MEQQTLENLRKVFSTSGTNNDGVIRAGARLAVVLPCYNEASAIAEVIRGFQRVLPESKIYVIDNASSDDTATIALSTGAIVISEPMRGKGNAVRRAFSEIDADIYVMADGDGTYDATFAPELIEVLQNQRLDMVVGKRQDNGEERTYRRGHRFGNWLFSQGIRFLFGNDLADVFSGYRIMTRRFVKSLPIISAGFELETELTVHALQLRLPIKEIETRYFERIAGGQSKLSTFRDGLRILWAIFLLTKQHRPFLLYSFVAIILATISMTLGISVVDEFFRTGLVPRLPTALLATGIMLLAALSLMTGLILHSISRNALETKRLFYLSIAESQ